MVVCLINHYYKILGDKLEKKHKIILAIVAILVIVGVCLYLNYQDTSIDAMTTTYYSGSGTICAKALDGSQWCYRRRTYQSCHYWG